MEEKFVKIFILMIVFLLYFLSIYSLISYLFWPNDTMAWYDYIIEIIAYALLATILFVKRKVVLKKIL